ncbi:MAG: tautomerase family protein [Cohaesibacter sp.]|nr:tautomerase family protein [Cohaesibacter sp.]
MPLYMCNAVSGTISAKAKAEIARDITDIHCAITQSPRYFVHAFFFDDSPAKPIHGKYVFLFGNIKKGRTASQKAELVKLIKASIHKHTGIARNAIVAAMADVPANWVMEGGKMLSETGPEDR